MKEREILVSSVLLLSVGLWNRCRAEAQALFCLQGRNSEFSAWIFQQQCFSQMSLAVFSDSATSRFCFAHDNELTN